MADVLDQLGLTLDLDDGHMVTDALLIMKVNTPDGETYVACRQTEGTDWVTARGLIAVAEDTERGGHERSDDEEAG